MKHSDLSDMYHKLPQSTDEHFCHNLLLNLQFERSSQVIHSVKGFAMLNDDIYLVEVDMESDFFGTKVKHTNVVLPYPYRKFEKYIKNEL